MERLNHRTRWAVLASLALLAALCVPQTASACGYSCVEVAPGCERCIYTGHPNANCANYAGSCGCYDVICWNPSSQAEPLEEAALTSLGFVPADLQLEPAKCAPAAAVAVAD